MPNTEMIVPIPSSSRLLRNGSIKIKAILRSVTLQEVAVTFEIRYCGKAEITT